MKKTFLLSVLLSVGLTLMAQTSEYCNYFGEETRNGDTYVNLTWETESNGDVTITMSEGEGVTSCSFRNGGFEGGIAAFVVSTDNFVSSTPASEYFTAKQVNSGNTYTLYKIEDATVPAGAKIKHIGSGHAFAWKVNGKEAYTSPDFIYTYGTGCTQIEAPTNVQVSADSVITFTDVEGAIRYTAFVYYNGSMLYRQDVVSGDVLHYVPFTTGTYQVYVVARGESGFTDSEFSEGCDWSLQAVEIELGESEYCEDVLSSGNTLAAFTWQTTAEGNIVITIDEVLGGTPDQTVFRNAMKAENFKFGMAQITGDNYFTASLSEDGKQSVLTLIDPSAKPATGEAVYYNAVVEYKTSLDANAWPTLEFNYTYGTVCDNSTVRVGVWVNNSEIGTAVVLQDGVEVNSVEIGSQATFEATPTDADLHTFVNWTNNAGQVVSSAATYQTTITEATILTANFDYVRKQYCQYPVNNTNGSQDKYLYLTLGSIGNGKYIIKFEGSQETPLTALNNAAYTINNVSTDIEFENSNMSGQDVPFSKANGRWNFSTDNYGVAWIEFSLAEGKTTDDIFVWANTISFSTPDGEIIYEDNQTRNGLFGNPAPLRHNIDWNATCSSTTTLVNNVVKCNKAKKMIQNDVLYIEVDGIRYNTLGQQVK